MSQINKAIFSIFVISAFLITAGTATAFASENGTPVYIAHSHQQGENGERGKDCGRMMEHRQNMSDEEKAEMRERRQNMSDEERTEMMERCRNMSDEERAEMREQHQNMRQNSDNDDDDDDE